jgi:hypothetical protein
MNQSKQKAHRGLQEETSEAEDFIIVESRKKREMQEKMSRSLL